MPPILNAIYRWSFTFTKVANLLITDDAFSQLFTQIIIHFESRGYKYVFQLERGKETGLLHYQGHLKLGTKLRLPQIIQANKEIMPYCHYSPDSDRGKSNAEFYCIKRDETYISGPWYDDSFEIPYDGSDLISPETFYPWQTSVARLIMEHEPHPDKINWIFQPAGGCGKSSFCKFMCFHFKYPQLIVCKPADLINLVYTSRISRCYFVDIQRTLGLEQTMDSLYSSLEQLKNGYIVNTKYVTGFKLFKKPHVVVFSNIMPNTSKLSNYKWQIYKVENNLLINHNF